MVIPEVAGLIIEELTAEMGVVEQRRWRLVNFRQFQEMIGNRQLLLESNLLKLARGPVFFDRPCLVV